MHYELSVNLILSRTHVKRFHEILENYPDNVIGVAIHYDDPLQVEYPNIVPFLISEFNIEYFPFALIDRTRDETTDWNVSVDQRLNVKYNAGVKPETKINDNYLEISVKYAANSDFEDILLTVYLTEDNVPESSPEAQYGGGGYYIHQKVLREVLTSKIGDPVELKKGIEYEKKYSVNISKYKTNDLNVVAFLHYGQSKFYEVINANSVRAGEKSDW